jgi:rhamnulokinase
MAQRCFLAVDLGAESGRVVAGLLQDGRVELQEIHRFANGGVSIGGSLRWDVVHLWSEIQQGIARAAQTFGDAIVSVGVDTWGVDYVLMTADDELLGLPCHYRDSRVEGMLNYAFSRVSREDIFAQTGLQFMEINTLYQLLAMNAQHPQLMQLADRFLMMPDFFHWLLSGSRVGEFTNATTTQCYHATAGTWANDMLRRLGLRPEIFPEVVQPGTRLGPLREDVARQARAPRFDVVAPATHDTGAAVVAVPTELTGAPRWAYISSGTWSLMGVEVADAVLTPRALELNVTNEGGVDGTYRLLKNIMGLWLVQECRRCFERDGRSYDYAALTQLAIEAPSLRSIVNPDDQRFFHPEDMPHEIRSFCRETGQAVPETDGQVVRCALESLALKYRMVRGWMEELTGTPVEAVHVVGGGSQNDLLNRFTANACGRPVVAGPVEATALGNVLLQARTAGDVGSLEEIRNVVRNSSQLTRYTPEDQETWAKAYDQFVNLHP